MADEPSMTEDPKCNLARRRTFLARQSLKNEQISDTSMTSVDMDVTSTLPPSENCETVDSNSDMLHSARSSMTRRSSTFCEDDFLTPVNVSPELNPVEKELNETFEKNESELNETFDKDASSQLITNDESRFELKLESTCHNESHSNLAAKQGRRLSSKSDQGNMHSRDNCIESENFKSRRSTSPTSHRSTNDLVSSENRDFSLLKRRSSILELSFASAPKRFNLQQMTPNGKGGQTSLINLNESIAFDFSKAAKTAEANGGVADMGSFVFSASSGLPVAKADNPADLMALEANEENLNKNGNEEYTRVSFIAMFDPIPDKIQDDITAQSPALSRILTRRSSLGSPLIKGLPKPAFVKQDVGKNVTNHDTEELDLQEGEEIAQLTAVIESQRQALLIYEQVAATLAEKICAFNTSETHEVSKLKSRLDEERSRNAQLEEAMKSMEITTQSTLNRMSEFRDTNVDLRKTVEEQTVLLQNLAEKHKHWEEESAKTERALSIMKLKLEAKDAELDSLNQQNSIARKELIDLRDIVKSVNVQ